MKDYYVLSWEFKYISSQGDYMPCVRSNTLFNSHFTTSGYWYVRCNWL